MPVVVSLDPGVVLVVVTVVDGDVVGVVLPEVDCVVG